MVVKFGVQQQRGQAGESAMGPKRGYNFANLYASNRSGEQTMAEVGKIQQSTQGVQQQVDRLGQQASQAAGRGLGGQKQPMNQMAAAVQKARSGSTQANQYNVAANMMKKTSSPYQAGIGSFYAGGQQAQQAARKFGNVFNEVQNTAKGWQERMPGMVQQGLTDKANSEARAAGRETDRKNALWEQGQSAYRDTLDNRALNPAGRMDNITWMLRTGRISAEDFHKAQQDEAHYNFLMNTVGSQGTSGNNPK